MLRDFFIKFRRSNAFLYTLVMFVLVWLLMHIVAHFDPEMTIANLALSIEASIATCMLLDLQFKMSAEDRLRWERIERKLEDVAEEVEEIEEVVGGE